MEHPMGDVCLQVFLTPAHLAIVMEYAASGEFFGRICSAGQFSEDEARFFFQQLISGVSYCHSMQICYRDLKLENTLLDEVLLHNLRYVTSVTQSLLYYTGNQNRPLGHQHILHRRFYRERSMMPRNRKNDDLVLLLVDCRCLVMWSDIRITIQEIKQLPWIFKNLPKELIEIEKTNFKQQEHNQVSQSVEEIMQIAQEAMTPGEASKVGDQALAGGSGLDDLEADIDTEVDVSGDYVTAV
ncbi:serine/threonine-protein kinase SAPK3-like [Cucumis melo var. makuwa]|uniref:non-specific serine/threonine protein kinase n=1 Tax=Cucumis melo var. makuwa TaxID=1194695 RepID=A0A5D3C5S5_CUCMM|nr:serine/threonine-protein kinase SAPK3-like [Cucumis melo var. makuwa]